jgi:hypothetical protein
LFKKSLSDTTADDTRSLTAEKETPEPGQPKASHTRSRGSRLVLSRVSHCDLRGHERAAVVGPAERLGPAVVVVDEGDDPLGQVVDRGELAAAQEPALQDGEEQLD